jgi:riboflavin kinase/FMN adenylyltransferase
LEVHLLNFEADLYGVEMKIEMIERLRGELAFAGADDLVAQMAIDSQMAADACAAQAR